MEPEAAAEGVGLEIRKLLAYFYVDDGTIASRAPHFLQECIDKLAALFDSVGFVTNTTKTEGMTFLPGNIRGCFSRETYKKRVDGMVIEGTRRRIPCKTCGAVLMEGSMRKHMVTKHGAFNLYLPPASAGDKDKEPRTFPVRTDKRGKYPCPANCPCPPARNF